MTLLDLINNTTALSTFKKDGTDDQAIADILNTKNVPTVDSISGNEFLTWATPLGVRADIESWKTDPDKIVRSIGLSLQDIILRQGGIINFSDSNNVVMLNYLVSNGKLDANNKASLLAASTINKSLAEINLGRLVTASDVSIALRGN